jgi:acyl-CoA reductase-like NAD-dependent aldehyde dehydrogenase
MNDQYRFLIDGRLVAGKRFSSVINPATEKGFAQAPRAGVDDINAAVAAAKKAYPAWSRVSVDDRRKVLRRIADAVDAAKPDLARLLTLEQGKPLQFAGDEVGDLSAFLRFYADAAIEPHVVEQSTARRVRAFRRPLGVVAGIVPWNFPVGLIGVKLSPALLMGNTFVLKPAGTTPLTALKLGEIIADIVPPGVVNIIADGNDLGDALTSHPDVRKISFTGSTATGKRVMESASRTVKRITLELGGNDAGIVLDDADPKAIAPGLFMGAFFNSGQVCVALKRLYVHESRYDAVCAELAKLSDEAVVDDGLKPGVMFGPLQNGRQYDRVRTLIEEGSKAGKRITQTRSERRPGYFIAPTVIRDIEDGHRLVDEEQFGPVLPVIRYTDLEEAIGCANASMYGLGASVWSSNPQRAASVASRLETGMVWINKHMDVAPHIPFCGAKSSGLGVEFGVDALSEFSQLQIVNDSGMPA